MSWPTFGGVVLGSDTPLQDYPRIVNAIQTGIGRVLAYLAAKTWLDTIVIADVQLKAGANKIAHGRKIQLAGWSIASQRTSAAGVFEVSRDAQFLYLQATGVTTIDLIVW
jgi:hypothetical protein